MLCYETLVDPTSFGVVRRYLTRPGSPITDVLFVSRESLLAPVARLLDGSDGQKPACRRLQFDDLLNRRQILPGATTHGFGIDVEAIADEALCRVIYLPPLYLVYLPCLDWAKCQRAAA
jgi:hypothetical protein